MKFLSKNMLAGLLAVFSGIMLNGASTWSAPERINEPSLRGLCFRAKARCATNVSGYQLQTDPIECGYAGRLNAALTLDEQRGHSVGIESQPCEDPRNFCNPTTEILYEDDLVRVIKKARATQGTDILIVSREHICNTHALDSSNRAHCTLLDRIWAVSQIIASYLPQDSTYTLMTNNGENRQGVYHLHVHFKSDSVLNESALRYASGLNALSNQVDGIVVDTDEFRVRSVQKPSLFTTHKVAFGLAVLGVAAVAAYKLYSWYKSR